MSRKRIEKEYLLDRAGVDAVSDEIGSWLKETGVKRQTILRLRLTMEELLLNICEHFGENMTGTLTISRRFGTPLLRFRYPGERYDPIQTEREEADEWAQELLSHIGLAPEWSYRSGVNELTLRGSQEILRSERLVVGAVILAVVFELLHPALPASVSAGLLNYLFSPISDAFMNVLNTFVGLAVFLSVVTGICSIGSVADFSRMGRYTITRLIRNTFLDTGICTLVLLPFFEFAKGNVGGGASQTDALIDLVFSIFPSDPVTPFAERNMLQIIFMAVVVGMGLLVLGNQTEKIRDLFTQTNLLFMQVIEIVCKLLPLYIFTSIVALFWTNGAGMFTHLWKPILCCAGVCLLLTAGKALYTSKRLYIRMSTLISKLSGTMLLGLVTASSSAAFGQVMDVNENKLGIAPDFCRFAVPVANLLTGSATGTAFLVILYYLSEYYATPVNFGWLVMAWLICSVLGMTVPPVSGGMLVCVGILMAQLNIPNQGLAVASLLAIIFDFIITAAQIGITHLELILQANHLNKLNRGLLEK